MAIYNGIQDLPKLQQELLKKWDIQWASQASLLLNDYSKDTLIPDTIGSVYSNYYNNLLAKNRIISNDIPLRACVLNPVDHSLLRSYQVFIIYLIFPILVLTIIWSKQLTLYLLRSFRSYFSPIPT